MKSLLIGRHAKSPWINFNVSDHDRELDSVGIKEASVMGKRLLQKNISFDLILTSSATRALTTCQLIASEIKYPLEKIVVNREIYGIEISLLKDMISRTPNEEVDSLAIFGHNPASHIFAEELRGEKINKFPTCSMIYIEFSTNSWKDCFNSKKNTIFFDYPEK